MYNRFHYPTIEALRTEAAVFGLPLAERIDRLTRDDLVIGGRRLANRIGYQPMEGCDGTPDGRPGELTIRRYRRFAAGGPGLIWIEAVAIRPEARANPRQLYLSPETLDSFRALFADIRETAQREAGVQPLLIVQLTHSGRYSKPEGHPAPLVMVNNPVLEGANPLPESCVLSDDYLMALEEDYGRAAALAEQAGADGVDIKCCHRYLLNESLSAYTRPGRYGGDFENRTRLYLNAVRAAKAAVSAGTIVTSRLNVFDGFPHPFGFGVAPGGSLDPDMREPLRLIETLHRELGMELLNVTAGNPYVNAYVNRPADVPQNRRTQHPLDGVARLLDCSATVQQAFPELRVMASGLSYLREYAGLVGEAMIREGKAAIAGFGRLAFAYPSLARDLCTEGRMRPEQCCVACGKCTELMRAGGTPGCVVRDAAAYGPLYRQLVSKT